MASFLFQRAELYAPDYRGVKDILVVEGGSPQSATRLTREFQGFRRLICQERRRFRDLSISMCT